MTTDSFDLLEDSSTGQVAEREGLEQTEEW